MSGMVWDEVQRMGAAIQQQAHAMPDDWAESADWFRVVEAWQALEAAISEAWPPEPVGTPVRTAEDVPMKELAARALDNATFQFLSHLELPMEELAGLAAAGAMPAPEPLVISDEKAKEIMELLAREHARPTAQISRERPDLLPGVLATTAAQDDARPESPYKPDLSDLVGWFNPDKVRASLADMAAAQDAAPPAFIKHRRCVDVDLGCLEAPDRFAYSFETIVAPAIQAMLDAARADRLTLLRLKVRRPDERHDGYGRPVMRLDFDCGDATQP
jgi:hypothetical protein